MAHVRMSCKPGVDTLVGDGGTVVKGIIDALCQGIVVVGVYRQTIIIAQRQMIRHTLHAEPLGMGIQIRSHMLSLAIAAYQTISLFETCSIEHLTPVPKGAPSDDT